MDANICHSKTLDKNRYETFLKECDKVCVAYGIDIDTYLKVTLLTNIIDFQKNVKFNQIFEWAESSLFFNYYTFVKEKKLKEQKTNSLNTILQTFFSRSKIKTILDHGHRFNIVFEDNTVSSYTKNDIIKLLAKN